MRFTTEFAAQAYKRFNDQIFGGRLPQVPLRLSDARTFVGKCAPRHSHILRSGHHADDDFYLAFSTAHDLTQAQAEDTVIHEMIHLFINLHNLGDTSHHGPLFKSLAASINATHNRHVTISHKTATAGSAATANAPTTAAPTAKTCAIAIIRDHKGWGFKLLPATSKSITRYYQGVINHVDTFELYVAEIDSYLAAYPVSSALHVYRLSRDQVLSHLSDPVRYYATADGFTRHK